MAPTKDLDAAQVIFYLRGTPTWGPSAFSMLVKSSEFRDGVLDTINKKPHEMGPLLKQWQEAHTKAIQVGLAKEHIARWKANIEAVLQQERPEAQVQAGTLLSKKRGAGREEDSNKRPKLITQTYDQPSEDDEDLTLPASNSSVERISEYDDEDNGEPEMEEPRQHEDESLFIAQDAIETPAPADEEHEEDAAMEIPDIAAGTNCVPVSTAQSKFNAEMSIMRGIPEQQIKDACFFGQSKVGRLYDRQANDFKELAIACKKFDFKRLQSDLLDFLNNRIRTVQKQKSLLREKGGATAKTQMPRTWDMSDPDEIYSALIAIKDTTDAAKIHRAFGQMQLYLTVKQKEKEAIKKGNKTLHGAHILEHRNILDDFAVKNIGDGNTETEKRKVKDAHKRESQAGERWLEVSKMFGGNTAVIIFVVAGIGNSYVGREWSIFQLKCLKIFANNMFAVKRLVGALGGNDLESYVGEDALRERLWGMLLALRC